MKPIETPRLRLRPLDPSRDADFVLRLLNEESFLRYIGDRRVRSLEDARRYIETGPVRSYAEHGFGLLLVEGRDDGRPLGICGLLKRDTLEHADVGFAFVPEAWGRGLAFESARAALDDARGRLGLARVLAVTQADNRASIRLLGRLGFVHVGQARLSEDGSDLDLYADAGPVGTAPPQGHEGT